MSLEGDEEIPNDFKSIPVGADDVITVDWRANERDDATSDDECHLTRDVFTKADSWGSGRQTITCSNPISILGLEGPEVELHYTITKVVHVDVDPGILTP